MDSWSDFKSQLHSILTHSSLLIHDITKIIYDYALRYDVVFNSKRSSPQFVHIESACSYLDRIHNMLYRTRNTSIIASKLYTNYNDVYRKFHGEDHLMLIKLEFVSSVLKTCTFLINMVQKLSKQYHYQILQINIYL